MNNGPRPPYPPQTAEHRAKISAALKGRPGNPKAIEAGAAARRGVPPSPRARQVASERWTGEGNPRWKDGRSRKRYAPGYWGRKLRKTIIERDRVCQDCGEWDDGYRAMHLHHLDGKRDNHDPSNLTLLCIACHKKRHRKH